MKSKKVIRINEATLKRLVAESLDHFLSGNHRFPNGSLDAYALDTDIALDSDSVEEYDKAIKRRDGLSRMEARNAMNSHPQATPKANGPIGASNNAWCYANGSDSWQRDRLNHLAYKEFVDEIVQSVINESFVNAIGEPDKYENMVMKLANWPHPIIADKDTYFAFWNDRFRYIVQCRRKAGKPALFKDEVATNNNPYLVNVYKTTRSGNNLMVKELRGVSREDIIRLMEEGSIGEAEGFSLALLELKRGTADFNSEVYNARQRGVNKAKVLIYKKPDQNYHIEECNLILDGIYDGVFPAKDALSKAMGIMSVNSMKAYAYYMLQDIDPHE